MYDIGYQNTSQDLTVIRKVVRDPGNAKQRSVTPGKLNTRSNPGTFDSKYKDELAQRSENRQTNNARERREMRDR